jgi:lipopolysaccharide transport system permease protein
MSSGLSSTADRFDLVITPPERWGHLNLRELWSYRELLYFLTKRELLIRYKQSIFGISWAVVQPLALAFLFALFFGRLAKVPSEGVPYPVFAMAGLSAWLFASMATTQSAASLIGDANLLSKVYFPRLVLPVAKLMALLVDLAISLFVVVLFMALYGVSFHWQAVFIPLFLLLAFVTALGVGLLLAALNVQYRDVNVAIPLAVQLWLFATPVVYPGSLITGTWQYIYAINPMVSVIQGMRWAFLGTPAPAIGAVAVSVTSASLGLAVGLVYFRRTERFFADII